MKKKLGALVLALASLALSAACASSKSWPQQPGDEATDVVGARPSHVPAQPANADAETDVQTEDAR